MSAPGAGAGVQALRPAPGAPICHVAERKFMTWLDVVADAIKHWCDAHGKDISPEEAAEMAAAVRKEFL